MTSSDRNEFNSMAQEGAQSVETGPTWKDFEATPRLTRSDMIATREQPNLGKTTVQRHVEKLEHTERSARAIDTQTGKLTSRMHLPSDTTATRAKGLLSRLVLIPKVEKMIREKTGLDVGLNAVQDKQSEVEQQVLKVFDDIANLRIEMQQTEKDSGEPPQPERQTISDSMAMISVDLPSDTYELARENMERVRKNIEDVDRFDTVRRSGLDEWLTADLEKPIYEFNLTDHVNTTVSRDHHLELLLQATNPAISALDYNSLRHFVKSLQKKLQNSEIDDDALRKVMCTYEIAVPAYVSQISRKPYKKQREVIFTWMRILELLVRLVAPECIPDKERIYSMVLEMTEQVVLEGALCNGVGNLLKNLCQGIQDDDSLAKQVFMAAENVGSLMEYAPNDNQYLVADSRHLYLLTVPLTSSTIRHFKSGVDFKLVLTSDLKFELVIEEINLRREVASHEQQWYMKHIPEIVYELRRSIPA